MLDWYQPAHVTQQDGSKCRGSNCWAAVGAWLLRAATSGVASVSPTAFRSMAGGGSGSVASPGCRSGFEADLVKGLATVSVKAAIVRLDRRAARRVLSHERRAVYAMATDYELWPEGKDCLVQDFDGNHMVGVIGGKPAQVMNPLCDEYQGIGLEALLDSATKFSVEHGRSGLVWLVRAFREVPKADAGDAPKAAMAELRRQVEERDDAIAEASSLAQATADALGPFVEEE